MRHLVWIVLLVISNAGFAEDNRKIIQALMTCNSELVKIDFVHLSENREFTVGENWVAALDYKNKGNERDYNGVLFYTEKMAYSCPFVNPEVRGKVKFNNLVVKVEDLHVPLHIVADARGKNSSLTNEGSRRFNEIYGSGRNKYVDQDSCSESLGPDSVDALEKTVSGRLDDVKRVIEEWGKEVNRFKDDITGALDTIKNCDKADGFPLRGQYQDVISKWEPKIGSGSGTTGTR